MSTTELITMILVLVVLITFLVLITIVIGQTIDEGDRRIGWITQLGAVLL